MWRSSRWWFEAFLRQGILVWSVGVAYILYDTALLIFTAIEIWPLRHGARRAGGRRRHAEPRGDRRRAQRSGGDRRDDRPAGGAGRRARPDPDRRRRIGRRHRGDAGALRPGAARRSARSARRRRDLPSLALAAAAARRQGARAQRRDPACRRGHRHHGRCRHLARTRRDRRDARRLRRRAGAGRGDRRDPPDVRAEPVGAAVRVVPDLRICPQLPVALRLGAVERAAARVGRVRRVPDQGGGRGRRVRSRLPGRGLRADPPPAPLRARQRARLARARGRRRAGQHRRARDAARVPAPAAALVRRVPADAALEPRHGRATAGSGSSAPRCCRSRPPTRCSRCSG